MRTLGIDEAGRGPVLGPLVVAGVMSDEPAALQALGVRDSKKLSPQRRRGLAREIHGMAVTRVQVIPADALDAAMDDASLNVLEAQFFAQVIRDLAPDEAIVDCCDTSEPRFKRRVLQSLGYDLPVKAEHGADAKYATVSAASIVAKVRRDEEMVQIGDALGAPVGSGYAHDPVTIAFLTEYVHRHGRLPPHVRHSWKTARRLMARLQTRTLPEFDG